MATHPQQNGLVNSAPASTTGGSQPHGGVDKSGSKQLYLPHCPVAIPVPYIDWQPNVDGLKQIISLFSDPPSSDNPALVNEYMQRQYEQMHVFSQHPEFNSYLAYILSEMHSENDAVRSRAGLKLKNNVRDAYKTLHPTVQQYIKQQTLLSLADQSSFIRNIVAIVISNIATHETLTQWQQLLPFLSSLMDLQQADQQLYVEAAFNTLSKISEDLHDSFYTEDTAVIQQLVQPINQHIIPKLIQYMLHPNEKIRCYALQTLNIFLPDMPSALITHIHAYMNNIYQLASDSNKEVRKRVCQAFVILVEVRIDLLLPHLDNVIKFMIHASNNSEYDDESVALEATEFWSVLCDTPNVDLSILQKQLPTLLPLLLQNMMYSEDDILMLDADDENETVPDRSEDIRPHFHHAKSHAAAGSDEDEDDDAQDEDASQWNLRKCSAASLDQLAQTFGTDLLPQLLPLLQQLLTTENKSSNDADDEAWKRRESGVLALGAIAEGCYEAIYPYLQQLIPFLLELLKDKKPLVRSITCWTISRYSTWIVEQDVATEDQYFKPVMIQLLQRVLDKHKKVQEAACSAFATFEEEAGERLVPYLKGILQSLMYAFDRYQQRNLLLLYDAIGTLAEAVGSALNTEELINVLMPPLIKKWNALSNDDRNIFPLLECLTSVAQSLNVGFMPFAPTVAQRCLQIISTTLIATNHAYQLAQQQGTQDVEYPDTEFVVCALDLLSGLAEGLQQQFTQIVQRFPELLAVLFECVRSEDADTRQSAFALLGDMAKTAIEHITPYLDKFIPVAAENLNPEYASVCNNASWCTGEIAVQVGGSAMQPYIDMLLQYLVPIMTGTNISNALLDNTVITIGRLGLVCPQQVSLQLPAFIHPYLRHLGKVKIADERYHAYKGTIAMIQVNPEAVLQPQAPAAFPALIDALMRYEHPTNELLQLFHELIAQYRQVLQHRWPSYFQHCSAEAQRYVHQTLKIQ